MIILSVESSCDETSVAITKDGKEVLSNVILSQVDIHAKFGGVVPEVASRNHLKHISKVFEEAIKEANITSKDIDLVAVTRGPGLIGSLLIGINAAISYAYSHSIPIIGVNHLIGHLYACLIENDVQFPAIGLLISGGHTELIHMKDHFDFEVLGTTLDDAVGETYDKIGRVLGLPYPGGVSIDKIAKDGTDVFKYVRVFLPDKPYYFSFSGLKRAVCDHIFVSNKNNVDYKKEDVAASLQMAIVDVLEKKVKLALDNTECSNLLVAGGVAANSEVRKRLSNLENINTYFPSIKYCGDNAAMIGIAAYYQYKKFGANSDYIIKADSRLEI
jgi:N6-L-threonylcarbamoyladenine synthase